MVKEKSKQTLSNDDIRKAILNFLDQKRRKARSLKSVQITVSEIKRGLKAQGISQSEVVMNLDYLVQNKWVIEEIEKRTFTTPTGFNVPSETRRYKLSDVGIRFVEGSSTFDTSNSFNGINITNMGGVTVIGNNNVVRNEYLEVFHALDQLENEVKLSDKIDDEKKLSAVSDIRTIKNQFSKVIPDINVLKASVAAISFLGSVDGLIDLYNRVYPLLQGFIH